MRLTPPKKIIWLLSFILAVVSIIAHFVFIPYVTVYAFWVMGVAWLLMFIGVTFKGI
jgi:hypothetical protein